MRWGRKDCDLYTWEPWPFAWWPVEIDETKYWLERPPFVRRLKRQGLDEMLRTLFAPYHKEVWEWVAVDRSARGEYERLIGMVTTSISFTLWREGDDERDNVIEMRR